MNLNNRELVEYMDGNKENENPYHICKLSEVL